MLKHYRMADILQKLFGSVSRLKLLRLFLFNPKLTFSITEAAERSQVKASDVRHEFALFQQMGLIKKARRGSVAASRYHLNANFQFVSALQNLLLNTSHYAAELPERVRRSGSIKCVVLAGIFLSDWEDARIDLLVVGDRINDRKLQLEVRKLESELGKELRYAALSTDQFLYRLNMNDHLIKDVFDFPHTVVYDRLHIGLK